MSNSNSNKAKNNPGSIPQEYTLLPWHPDHLNIKAAPEFRVLNICKNLRMIQGVQMKSHKGKLNDYH